MNSTTVKYITNVLYFTIKRYNPIKTLSPHIEDLVKIYSTKELSGLEKQSAVLKELTEIKGELGTIALGLLEGSLSFLLNIAVGIAHAYLKSHNLLPNKE